MQRTHLYASLRRAPHSSSRLASRSSRHLVLECDWSACTAPRAVQRSTVLRGGLQMSGSRSALAVR